MTTTKPFVLGSVSQGTMRTEDLLPVFLDALDPKHPTFMSAWLYMQSGGLLEEFDAEPIDHLVSALNDQCPPFVYFGAHPGDGADFGFWPDWDALADAGIYCERSIEQTTEKVIVQAANGNVTVMDLDRNVLWTTV